jgi:hypothetical protein
LKRIKEIEDKERKHGPTEFSERRKSELKQLHQSLLKRERREQEEKHRQEKIAEAARAKQREQEAAVRAKQREQEEEAAAAAFAANAPGVTGQYMKKARAGVSERVKYQSSCLE